MSGTFGSGNCGYGFPVPPGVADRHVFANSVGMADFALSITMLAAIALLVGAIFLFRRGDRRRALLMALAGVVALANVAVWVMPTPQDTAQRP